MATDHKMMCIVHPVNLLVETEFTRAAQMYGEKFGNVYEAYGVLAEEVQEAEEEWDGLIGMQAQMLKAIRKSNAKAIMDYADRLRDYAVNCAAELIQVAAMCEKTVRTVRGE